MKKLEGGAGDQFVNDVYLRSEFPPPGKARAPRPGDTPTDVYHNRLNAFSQAVEGLELSFAAIRDVVGDDGRSLVEARGADPRSCLAWRDVLRKIDEELIVWGSTFKRMYGTTAEPSSSEFADGEGPTDSSEHEDDYAESYDEWDTPEESGKVEVTV